MIATQTQTQKQIIEIHIIRHGNFYFYSRHVNGISEIFGEVITRQRAEQIIIDNQADDEIEISTRGEIVFEPGTEAEFSFIAKWVVENG